MGVMGQQSTLSTIRGLQIVVFVLEIFQALLEISRTQFYTSRIYRKKGCSREVLHQLFSRILENSRINIFNILYLELGAARLNMMSI